MNIETALNKKVKIEQAPHYLDESGHLCTPLTNPRKVTLNSFLQDVVEMRRRADKYTQAADGLSSFINKELENADS